MTLFDYMYLCVPDSRPNYCAPYVLKQRGFISKVLYRKLACSSRVAFGHSLSCSECKSVNMEDCGVAYSSIKNMMKIREPKTLEEEET